MQINEVKEKIQEIRKIMLETKVTMLNYEFIDKLLDIERKLWDLMFFIKNQEKNWLIK